MNTAIENTQTTKQSAKVAKPAKAKAQDSATLEKQVETLTAQVATLESQLAAKQGEERQPVSTGELLDAIAKLQAMNKADVSKLQVSLRSVLGFVPELTKVQKKELWQPAKKAIERAHSAWTKENAGTIIAHARRAIKNPQAIMASRLTKRKKDGKVTGFRLAGKNLAPKLATKGKGKNGAKPSQVAGKVSPKGTAHAQAASKPAGVS